MGCFVAHLLYADIEPKQFTELTELVFWEFFRGSLGKK